MNNDISKVRILAYSALFAAIATVVMYIEFPLPLMPPFLKVDLSGAVTMIAAFMFGWAPAVMITLVKDIIHAFSTTTGCTGELADFLITSFFAITAALIYRKMHTKKGALLACGCASLVMALAGVLANKFIIIPFYTNVMPIESIIGLCAKINPNINSLNAYLLFGAFPFNLIKGVILSLVTQLLYKHLSHFIKKNTVAKQKES